MGLTFHRVVDDFMAQTSGNPLGTGEGASTLPDLREEFMFRRGPDMPFVQAAEQSRARLRFSKALPIESQPDAQMAVTSDGRVVGQCAAIARVSSRWRVQDDPNSANSQFFIMRQPNTALNKRYTVFGRVVWGQNAVMQIAVGNPPPNPDPMVSVPASPPSMPEAGARATTSCYARTARNSTT